MQRVLSWVVGLVKSPAFWATVGAFGVGYASGDWTGFLAALGELLRFLPFALTV